MCGGGGVLCLCQRDPSARLSCMRRVLEHPFFTEEEIDVSSMAPLPLPTLASNFPSGTPVHTHGAASLPSDPEGSDSPGIFVCSGANSGKEARELQRALVEANPNLRGRVWVGPQDENQQLATSDDDRRAAVNAHGCFVLYLTSDVFKVSWEQTLPCWLFAIDSNTESAALQFLIDLRVCTSPTP